MSLEDYKDFVLFCKEQGVLSAQMGDYHVSFGADLGYQELEALEDEEDAPEDEDPLFYSAGS